MNTTDNWHVEVFSDHVNLCIRWYYVLIMRGTIRIIFMSVHLMDISELTTRIRVL